MRAGTLSDDRVTRRLRRAFVAAWTNTDGEAQAGGSFAHAPGEPAPTCLRGNGEHNVQLLFLTPDGRLLGLLAGYVDAADLLEELDLVRACFEAIEAEPRPAARREIVGVRHLAFADRLAERTWEGPLGDGARRRAVEDHRFVARHALLPVADVPLADHLGRGASFFGSSRGGRPAGRIGAPPPRELEQHLRGFLDGAEVPADRPDDALDELEERVRRALPPMPPALPEEPRGARILRHMGECG